MLLGFIGLAIPLVLLAALVVGLVKWVGRGPQSGLNRRVGGSDTLAGARRIFTYTIAFAGLLAVLYAASGLLAIAVGATIPQGRTLIGVGDLRDRTSFSLAALIVGLPLWLGFWLAARRRVGALPSERDATERRLFLAAVFATTAVVALFAAHTMLRFALTLPGSADARPSTLDGIVACARLTVYGAAWLAYARLAWSERSARDDDETHDLAVYVLAGFSLSFLVVGLGQTVNRLVGDLVGVAQPTLITAPADSPWSVWGNIAAWVVSGSLIWAAVWRYDVTRGGRRALRVVYLYVVLLVSALVTLVAGADTLNEFLRRLFGYRAAEGQWIFLRDVLPLWLVGGGVWAYHWLVMRRQATLDGSGEAVGARIGGIPWPRRPAVALLALAGLAMVVPAVISVLWLGLDAALRTDVALSGPDWWRDRLSVSLAAGLVGIVAWLGAWSVLRRAAVADPAGERLAWERRLLVGGAALVGALAALGFAIALLWIILKALLGEQPDARTTSQALKDASTVGVLVVLSAYYGLMLRRDLRVAGARLPHVRVIALVAPGADAMLAEARRSSGRRIEVVGRLAADDGATRLDKDGLYASIHALGSPDRLGGHVDGALLILYLDGGTLLSYTRGSSGIATVRARGIGAAEAEIRFAGEA